MVGKEEFPIRARPTHNSTTLPTVMLEEGQGKQRGREGQKKREREKGRERGQGEEKMMDTTMSNLSLTLLLSGVNLVLRQCMHVEASASGTQTAACSVAGLLLAVHVIIITTGNGQSLSGYSK